MFEPRVTKAAACASSEALRRVNHQLGQLPPFVRYYDDYSEQTFSFDPKGLTWEIQTNGSASKINFVGFDSEFRLILNHYAAWRVQSRPASAAKYINSLSREWGIVRELLHYAILGPDEGINFLRSTFKSAAMSRESPMLFQAGKALIYFFSEFGLAGWEEAHANILKTLRGPVGSTPLRSVRDRSAIISHAEESQIISYLDSLAQRANGDTGLLTPVVYRDAAILILSYQHGIRPVQIANRNLSHVRLRRDAAGEAIVHITFRYAKQKARKKTLEQTRKMKRAWNPIFEKWLEWRSACNNRDRFDREDSLFGLSPDQISRRILEVTDGITGNPINAYRLRHSAAMRKADTGCSRLELAYFLMHSDVETANAYIEMSPTQAEKINSALGLSPLFQAIGSALKSRSVDHDSLLGLPDDNQISGAPHGHLIAGIGGCSGGVSACSRTPALACYDCHKFMYLRDRNVHVAARNSIRQIVTEFAEPNAGAVAPAFGQLRRILDSVEAIISDLDQEAQTVS